MPRQRLGLPVNAARRSEGVLLASQIRNAVVAASLPQSTAERCSNRPSARAANAQRRIARQPVIVRPNRTDLAFSIVRWIVTRLAAAPRSVAAAARLERLDVDDREELTTTVTTQRRHVDYQAAMRVQRQVLLLMLLVETCATRCC